MGAWLSLGPKSWEIRRSAARCPTPGCIEEDARLLLCPPGADRFPDRRVQSLIQGLQQAQGFDQQEGEGATGAGKRPSNASLSWSRLAGRWHLTRLAWASTSGSARELTPPALPRPRGYKYLVTYGRQLHVRVFPDGL